MTGSPEHNYSDMDIIKIQKKAERKAARRCVNGASIMYVAAFALENLFFIAYSAALPAVLHFLSDIFANVTGRGSVYSGLFIETVAASGIVRYFMAMVASFLCVFLPFLFYGRVIERREFDEIAPMGGKLMRGFIPAYAASQLMASAVSVMAQGIGSVIVPDLFTAEGNSISGYAAGNGFELVVIFLSVCVLTPFVEEFVFRGVIYGSLRRFGKGFAVVASSLIFGLAHGSVSQMAYAFAFGVALALVFEITGSLKTSILFHFINNTLNYVLFILVPYFADNIAANMVAVVYNAVCGVIAAVGLIMIFADKQKDTHETAGITVAEPTEKQEVGISCMITPGMILLAALFVWMVTQSL